MPVETEGYMVGLGAWENSPQGALLGIKNIEWASSPHLRRLPMVGHGGHIRHASFFKELIIQLENASRDPEEHKLDAIVCCRENLFQVKSRMAVNPRSWQGFTKEGGLCLDLELESDNGRRRDSCSRQEEPCLMAKGLAGVFLRSYLPQGWALTIIHDRIHFFPAVSPQEPPATFVCLLNFYGRLMSLEWELQAWAPIPLFP